MESFAMNGGDGPNSYSRFSTIQGEGVDRARFLIHSSIQQKLDLARNSRIFRIADLGCSTGPNTFSCVQNIVEAVELKHASNGLGANVPEFLVLFNDHVANDFNTLFRTLPSDKQYFAAGVPGSFYGRLFPKESMNFIHSSYAVHWLSRVPEEVRDRESPAWNKGRISYVGAPQNVVEAYTAQFVKDMEKFLVSRAEEMALEGLMVLLIPCRLEGTLPAESLVAHGFDCLGSALMDMAKEGLINEDLVDSFNLPIFIPTASEVKKVVLRNKSFSIEIMEALYCPTKLSSPEYVTISCQHIRAAVEGIICKHFGSQVVDELFRRYLKKVEDFYKTPFYTSIEKMEDLFLLVKRNVDESFVLENSFEMKN